MENKDQNQTFKTLGLVMSASFTMGISVFVGYLVGSWLDKRLGTEPWLTFLMFILGAAAGMRSLYGMAFPKKEDS